MPSLPSKNEAEKWSVVLLIFSRKIYSTIRSECGKIEEKIRDAEKEVIHSEDGLFMIHKGEVEIGRLIAQQAVEVKKKNETFKAMVQARAVRKGSKKVLRLMARETKVCAYSIQTEGRYQPAIIVEGLENYATGPGQ